LAKSIKSFFAAAAFDPWDAAKDRQKRIAKDVGNFHFNFHLPRTWQTFPLHILNSLTVHSTPFSHGPLNCRENAEIRWH